MSHRNQRGASLIETLVALGILGMIAYFVVGMIKNGTVGQKTLQAQDDARTITDNMAAILSDSVACGNTFANPAGPAVSPKNGFNSTSFSIIDGSATPQKIYTTGNTYGNRGVSLISLTVGAFNTPTNPGPVDVKTGVKKWIPSGAGGAALVLVAWQQTGSAANTSGPTTLYRYFLLNVLSLNAGTGAILACVAQSAAGSNFWSLNGGDIHNNNNNGTGNVGIGTSLPLGLLDVYAGSGHALTVSTAGSVSIGTSTATGVFSVYAGSQNALSVGSNGSVSIGTSPGISLDVAGWIRPGPAVSGASCPQEGAMGYDKSVSSPVFCTNATGTLLWTAMGAMGPSPSPSPVPTAPPTPTPLPTPTPAPTFYWVEFNSKTMKCYQASGPSSSAANNAAVALCNLDIVGGNPACTRYSHNGFGDPPNAPGTTQTLCPNPPADPCGPCTVQ